MTFQILRQLKSERRHLTNVESIFWKEERSLLSLKLILIDLSYIESQKYKLCNIASFKFTAYNASISRQKTSNLMVKHVTRSQFLGVFL